MQCFYHSSTPAIGICKACLRGVCKDCAAELDGGLACRGKCEQEATNLIKYVRESVRRGDLQIAMTDSYRKNAFYPPLLLLTVGAAYMYWSYTTEGLGSAGLVGGLFLIFGVLSLLRAVRLKRVASGICK